jgi:hypothetical protein
VRNKKVGNDKFDEVWDKTLYVRLLNRFKPERLDVQDYQFTLSGAVSSGESGVMTSGKDQTVRIFNFEIPNRGPWSVEMVVKEGDIPIWHNIVYPQRQADWMKLLGKSSVNPAEAERFLHALVHSYNKAQKAVKNLPLEYHSDRESIDTQKWPLNRQIEIVPNYAVEGGYCILFGEPGVGKTILAHNVGLQAASGFKGKSAEDSREPIVVFFLSLEMNYDQFRERHNELSRHFPDSIRDRFFFSCPDSFDFTNHRDRSMLHNSLTKTKSKLLIVDGHSYWIGDRDENSNSEIANKVVVPLKELAKGLELGVILIHHSGWEESKRIRGASVLWVGAELGVHMEQVNNMANQTKVTFRKWRLTSKRKPRPIAYSYNPDTYTMNETGDTDFLDQLKLPASSAEVKTQIMKVAGVQLRQASNKLKMLLSQGYLKKDEEGLMRRPERTDDSSIVDVNFRNTKRKNRSNRRHKS